MSDSAPVPVSPDPWRAMSQSGFEHVREDIRNAMVENRNDDPALLPELVMYLLGELGTVAQRRACICTTTGNPEHYDGPTRECPEHGEPLFWATAVLERCQIRAVSQIPFGESDECDQDHDPDWRDHL